MKNSLTKLFACRFHLQSQWLIALAAFYFTTVLNPALWRYFISHLEITGIRMLFFGISMPVFIFTAIFLFFNLLPAYFIKPVLIVLLLISSATNYFMFQLGVFIDADMIRNAFETNTREAFDLVTFRMILWIVLGGVVLSFLLVIPRIEYRPFWKECLFRLFAITGCVLVIGIIAAFFTGNTRTSANGIAKWQNSSIHPAIFMAPSVTGILNHSFSRLSCRWTRMRSSNPTTMPNILFSSWWWAKQPVRKVFR